MTIKIKGDITEETFIMVAEKMAKIKPNEKLTLIIDSSGGSVKYGQQIFQLIDRHNGPKEAIIKGDSSSLSAYIIKGFEVYGA